MLPRLHSLLPALLLVMVGACATQSVRHLAQQPWTLNKAQSMQTNYLQFDYVCTQSPKGLKVEGTAHPVDPAIPDWAVWTKDLWLGAYLSDRTGQVLAKQLKILPPQRVAPGHPISFIFILQPESMGQPGPVFISFGYRLVLTPSPKDSDPPGPESETGEAVFFASESALTRF